MHLQFFLRDWNNETKFHLTIPTKAKHSLTGIKIFTDNISCFLKISFRNFRSINGFGRRTMKNVRHLMWRVVNYDQFEGFTFHTQRKKWNLVESHKQESCHAHANFHYSLKTCYNIWDLIRQKIENQFICLSIFRYIAR